MKYFTIAFLILSVCVLLVACGDRKTEVDNYTKISAEEAKNFMETEKNYIILDVRTESEYSEKHIPGAILIPDFEIRQRAETELPDKEQLILVYCRSGNRSKLASEELVKMGYTNVKDFGGINSWNYDVE